MIIRGWDAGRQNKMESVAFRVGHDHAHPHMVPDPIYSSRAASHEPELLLLERIIVIMQT